MGGWRLESRPDGSYQAVRSRKATVARTRLVRQRYETTHTVRERHALTARTYEEARREFNAFLKTKSAR